MTPFELGFRKIKFTKLTITPLYDRLLQNLVENKITSSILFNLKEIFDSVKHKILLKKFYYYGLCVKMFKLLTSYFIDWHKCVKQMEKILLHANWIMEDLNVQYWDLFFFNIILMTFLIGVEECCELQK